MKWIRRLRYGAPVVVVSGLPRSGTSMAMKMLEAGGLELVTDEQRTADEDNPKGYFEDERVKDLADDEDRGWIAEARGKGIKVISFLLKDLPRTHSYKVVFMRRDLDEVLASQQKMLDRRGEQDETPDDQMRELWENHLWRVRYMLDHDKNFEWVEVPYREALEDPSSAARRIADFVGGLDAEKMARVVDPSLYRNRA
ncbi:MAG: sulfotransferase family protein [Acidobacteria bacterium]|nr:MAG: sulfotransferase family protein [Acidobacteriota bacterium]REK08439.1 MAG: sulfotransferase family protein [Acidobacteriota bacterium]